MFARNNLGVKNALRLLERDDPDVDHKRSLLFFVPKMGILEKLCVFVFSKR